MQTSLCSSLVAFCRNQIAGRVSRTVFSSLRVFSAVAIFSRSQRIVAMAALGWSAALGAATAGSVTLSWQDNSSNETGFRIERGTDGATFAPIGEVAANVTSFNDSTAVAGATYWFRVNAYNSQGSSPYSNVTSATIAPAPANTAPTISDVANQSIAEDASTGAIAFSVGDAESSAGALVVSAQSSNSTLVPSSGLLLGGSGSNRTLTVTPAANRNGTATITLTVSDGALTATDTFVLTVTAVNDAPTISTIVDRTISSGGTTGAIAFTVSDVETYASSLTVTASSSNTTLVPTSGLVLGGSGASRTLSVTPAAGLSGNATIAVRVSDGSAFATVTFVLTVNAVNTAPTVSDLASMTIAEDGSTGARAFIIGDAQTAAGSLVVTASSSNLSLVPAAGLVLGGSGANRTLTVTPASNQHGSATITVTVSDGVLTASDSFVLHVTSVNDAPVVSSLSDHVMERGTVLGPVSFTVSDVETAAGSLVISGVSSNQTLVPDSNISFGGSGANRTLTVTPVPTQSGSATITVRASDGTETGTRSFALTVTFASQALVSSDLGRPALSGSTTSITDGFQIRAAGADIYGRRDQFHFARQQVSGDAELIVRVSSLTRTHSWAKAGLMFRGSLADNAPHVSVFLTPSSGVVLQWRSVAGGNSSSKPAMTASAPEWLRLIRSGNVFYAFHSHDGVEWEFVEYVTVNLPEVAYAGLAVTSHNTKSRTTAVFEQFEVD